MNHILIFPEDLIDKATARLCDQRCQHIQSQLKATLGSRIKIGLWRGDCGYATITAMDADSVSLHIDETHSAPLASPIKLLLAMPRPKVLRRVLRNAIEHGVKDIRLINSWKVEKSYWQTPWLAEQSLHEINCEALSLAKDTHPAQIHCHKRFKPFVEDELPELMQGHDGYIAHPSEIACPSNVTQPSWLAIGPEGGFTEYEVNMLVASGFNTVSLGSRILRVENAVSSAIARLNPI